jgi:hypothetical protein
VSCAVVCRVWSFMACSIDTPYIQAELDLGQGVATDVVADVRALAVAPGLRAAGVARRPIQRPLLLRLPSPPAARRQADPGQRTNTAGTHVYVMCVVCVVRVVSCACLCVSCRVVSCRV